MLKLIAFAVFLLASPSFGLLETLFRAQSDCYSGCRTNYPASLPDLFACQSGCDYKLHNENCADQCKILSVEEQTQASCLVGCSMTQAQSVEQPQSITVIRIRPSVEASNEQGRPTLLSISEKIRKIFELTGHLSNQPSHEEDSRSVTPPRVPHSEHLETSTNRLQQYVRHVQGQWNDLIHKQAKTALWLLFGLFLLSSILLGYMVISLCCRRPSHHALSIRAQDLLVDNHYEKEKIQPYEHYYDPSHTAPIQVKLANI